MLTDFHIKILAYFRQFTTISSFSSLMELTCEVISCLEPAVSKMIPSLKIVLQRRFDSTSSSSSMFFLRHFKRFINVFCFGLKFFHAMCGLPKEFRIPDILNRQLNFDEHVGTSTLDRLKISILHKRTRENGHY